MEDPKHFELLLKRLLRDGGESADIYHEGREDFRVSLSSDGKALPLFGFSEGIALRLFRNGFCGSIHLESPGEKEICSATDFLRISSRMNSDVLSIKGDAKGETSGDISNTNEDKSTYAQYVSQANSRNLLEQDLSQIPSIIEEIGHLLKDSSKNKLMFSINASFYRQKIEMFDSNGNAVEDLREGALLRVKTLLKEGSLKIFSEVHLEFSSARDFKGKIRPHEIVEEVIQKSLERQNSARVPSGEMPLVLSNGSGGVFIHETVGHLFEADNPLMESSYDEIKKYRFGKNISIFDDPSLMVRGQYRYDDEGIMGKKKPLIILGKWAGFLHNVRTARQKRTESNGNGRRQSFRDIPLPRTSAIYMENGEILPEDVVKSVKLGIFASGFGKCIFEESSGNFSINVTEGNLIRNGKISEPISGALITGNSFEVLKSTDLVANDLKFDRTGLACTKFGQTIPSSVGTPTIRIALIKVVPQ